MLRFVPVQDLTVGVPNYRNCRIAGYHFHKSHRLFRVAVQRKELHHRVQNLRHAVTVQTDQPLCNCRTGEIAVGDHNFIAVSHFHEYFQKLRCQNLRNVFQHKKTPPIQF